MMPTVHLLHLWGPFSINSFGLMIALGGILTFFLAQKDKLLMKLITPGQLSDLATLIIVAGIFGGRALYIGEDFGSFSSVSDMFMLTDGGFSLLGGLFAATLAVQWYLRRHRLRSLFILDRVAIYIPLLYSISRIGCFFAGCCYGNPTSCWCAIEYTNPDVFAPCFISIHPTQLYSSALAMSSFLFLYLYGQYHFKKAGQLFGIFLIIMGIERFFVDFLRADRIMIHGTSYSTSQVIALAVVLLGIIKLYASMLRNTSQKDIYKQ